MRTSSSLLRFRTWASGQCQPCVLRLQSCRFLPRFARGNLRLDTPFSTEVHSCMTAYFPFYNIPLFYLASLLFPTSLLSPIKLSRSSPLCWISILEAPQVTINSWSFHDFSFKYFFYFWHTILFGLLVIYCFFVYLVFFCFWYGFNFISFFFGTVCSVITETLRRFRYMGSTEYNRRSEAISDRWIEGAIFIVTSLPVAEAISFSTAWFLQEKKKTIQYSLFSKNFFNFRSTLF